MEISLNDVEGDSYQNFVDTLRDKDTARKYKNYLYHFLNLIPNPMYKRYLGYEPNSREIQDLSTAFTEIAKKNVKSAKAIINAYVRDLKKQIEEKKLAPGTAINRLKPIKALLKANDIEISWYLVDKSLPKVGTAKDRAYRREELQMMMRKTTKTLDKVIITLTSSAGFRIEAWDFFTWEDAIIFRDDKGVAKGGALRVYRGDIEEYWTHFTPEAARYLDLYKEEWKSRFFDYPKSSDPLLITIRNTAIKRLSESGVKRRTTAFVKAIGMRPTLEPGQKRHEVMLDHGFRKYQNTMLRRAKVDFADKEDMQGRSPGGQEKSYERYEETDFERWDEYQKAIPFLTVSEEERAKAELIVQMAKNDELENANNKLEVKEEKINEIESKLDLVAKQMHSNQSVVPSEENLDKMIKMLQKLKKI